MPDTIRPQVVDPTANVIALTEAANKRQDDLRQEQNRYIDTQVAHVKELAALRAEHQQELAEKESGRLDAIRQIDQAAVMTAQSASNAAIQTLAVQTKVTAEAIAAQGNVVASGLSDRIMALEKTSYQGQGKQLMSDPMMAELLAEVKDLKGSRAEGSKAMWGYVVGGIGVLIAVFQALRH